jgi:transposase
VTPAMSAGHSARQVFDLPEPTPLVVTEHRAHDCRCTSRASFPHAYPHRGREARIG